MGLMDEAELALLCVSQCRADLDSLRTTIAGACTGDQDVVTYDDTVYPGKWLHFTCSSEFANESISNICVG